MNELTISGEVGYRKDGSVDVLTSMGENHVVWNIDFTENASKFIISLTDATEIEDNRRDYEILHSFETDDSIEARVEIANLVREWIPNVSAEYLDCLKDMVHRAWGAPIDVKMALMMHQLANALGMNQDDEGNESWD